MHDPAIYKNPLAFYPERFMGPDAEPDPQIYIWGFGRRVCPGRVIADFGIWLTLASVLTCFDITQPDADAPTGIEASKARPEWFVPGTISHPQPFDVKIKVRSEEHVKLVRAVEEEHPWGGSGSDELNEIVRGMKGDAVVGEKHGGV